MWFGVVSYALAALVFSGVTAVLLIASRGARPARGLVIATAVSAIWGGVTTALVNRSIGPAVIVVDVVHLLTWTMCVCSWIAPARPRLTMTPSSWLRVLSILLGAWTAAGSSPFGARYVAASTILPATLCMAFVGLLAVEQVIRNAQEDQRRRLKNLCMATGGIFAVDIFTYSQAILLDGFAPFFWEARGVINAALGALLLIGVKRQAEWEKEIFISRQVVFYTATLLGVGVYLLAMGAVAYVIRAMGGEWTFLPELTFLIVAAGLLLGLTFLSTIKARFRVFLIKHFFRNKYDYRQEWLRLTQRLGVGGDVNSLAANALEGLAAIIGARHGHLWLARNVDRYEWMTSLAASTESQRTYDRNDVVVRFLAEKGWVIDSEEYANEPDRYDTAFGDPADHVIPRNCLVVPLNCQGFLQGFAILAKPAAVGSLNFEDHDLLKTAGKQVAVVLAQALTLEKLAETKQFEATNKMSTFLMHDLKNIIAQQQLVVSNAAKFRHRPEFIDDAIATIRSGVERMVRLLEQIRRAPRDDLSKHRADVSKVLLEVRSRCADCEPVPSIEVPESATWVAMDRDRLTDVLIHLVRNAQQATPRDGNVSLSLAVADGFALVTVADNGCGMDYVFVRDRLFRPFDSTKGAQGMGIGAYQVRDTVRSVGGEVEVASAPNAGSSFRVRLPLVEIAAAAGPAA
jgi:putative PEP-CTERM system histidine kinase